MKKNSAIFILLTLVMLSSMLFEISNISGVSDGQVSGDDNLTVDLANPGGNTIDWTMEEIMSDTMMTFSNFAGKVVLIDFFAMWCGPCVAAMPYLRNINDHFSSESDFAMMSIDVDTTEQESAIETFAANNNMNWYIFRDTLAVNDFYGVSAIPTLMIINQNQYVYYIEEGFAGEEVIKGVIQELLDMDDQAAPVLTNFVSDNEQVSIVEDTFTVSVDVTEDAIRYAEFNLTMGDYEESQTFWAPDSGTIECTFELDPIIIYNETQDSTTSIDVDLVVEDFTGKKTTDYLAVDIENITDATPPSVAIDQVIETDGTYGQTFEIHATIIDDTLVKSATLEIWTHGKFNTSQVMTTAGDSVTAKFYSFKVATGEEIVFKIIAEDVSGKNTTHVVDYKVSLGAGISFPMAVTLFVLGGLLLIPIQRLAKKK